MPLEVVFVYLQTINQLSHQKNIKKNILTKFFRLFQTISFIYFQYLLFYLLFHWYTSDQLEFVVFPFADVLYNPALKIKYKNPKDAENWSLWSSILFSHPSLTVSWLVTQWIHFVLLLRITNRIRYTVYTRAPPFFSFIKSVHVTMDITINIGIIRDRPYCTLNLSSVVWTSQNFFVPVFLNYQFENIWYVYI